MARRFAFMKRAAALLGLVLIALPSCQARGAPMNLHYVVTTPQGGIVQKLTVKGKQAADRFAPCALMPGR